MKLSIFENKGGLSITLTPETVEEVVLLTRSAKNAKKKPITMNMYFSDNPSCDIWIEKVSESKQSTIVNNRKS